MPITLPTYFSARSAQDTITACWEIASAEGLVDVDASELKFVDPFGMALLAATFYKVNQHGGVVRVHCLSEQLSGYLRRMDLFQGVELVDCAPMLGQRQDRADALVEVTRLEQRRDVDAAALRLTRALVGRMPVENRDEQPDEMTGYTESDRLAEPIQYAFNELLENALTHARRAGYQDACVWVACQYYPTSDVVRLGVVDNGCGFLATLRGHAALTRETHLAAILAALQPRVSCNRDLGLLADSVNQGVGLTTTQRIATSAGGRLYIASGDAIHSSAAFSHLADGVHWQGVAIALECKRQRLPEVHFRDLLPPLEPQAGVKLRFQ
jgi:anti-anti-sigma regulatory factor/anti-sigma regulatory factor (Ser/Thr protein kinase)